jgi:hypothetical protein
MSGKLKSRIVGKTYSISVALSTRIFEKYEITTRGDRISLDIYSHMPAGA